jgi:hypothetical protein
MQAFEKLGIFYLGRTVQPDAQSERGDYLLYDAKDLVTHAVCVGMTGSGKTGLCLTLLEEAAIDGVPALIIDPKGDLGNLLLTFPELRGTDFRPWINEDEARRQGMSPEQFAEAEASRWRAGLADWEQDGDRIRRLREAADFAIYTPGSSAGLPVSILSSFAAPPPQYFSDADLLKERVASTASGLLGLIGIQADPLRSREHILVSNILGHFWQARQDLTLPALIQAIQSPPVQKIGVFDLESFYPSADRFQLAMALNNLLAAPGFETWLEGDPLDVGSILYTKTGKPRCAIFSIAHLSDAERMFFVTMLLNQTLSWMRTQSGTSSLRALLYMDEIFGFFPPVAEPPSKRPLLTLLKQARAFGLGVVVATQNPVDLDYKGLSNMGTWFIGRLQTERDRERLVEGLSGIVSYGSESDQKEADRLIAGLQKRVFLMQNVHESRPALFTTRWCMSYLAGPLTRTQIKELSGPRAATPATDPETQPAPRPASAVASGQYVADRPSVPAELRQHFAPAAPGGPQETLVYHAHLFAGASLQIVNNRYGVNATRELNHALELRENMLTAAWDEAVTVDAGIETFQPQPQAGARFAPLPTAALQPKRLAASQKGYADYAYRISQSSLWKSSLFKVASQPGESERDFRMRLQQLAREKRDFELNRLRRKYADRMATLQQRLMRIDQKVEREQEQYKQQGVQTAISVGATLLGALMGRKAVSAATLGRATTATRQASKILREKQDVARVEEERTSVQQQIQEMERRIQEETDQLMRSLDPHTESLQEIIIRPAKADILPRQIAILWVPCRHDSSGAVRPAWPE